MDEPIILKPSDLRGILKYVPLWRGHTFVVAVDGAVVADRNMANLFLDIAVLRSLNIRPVLIFGIGHQLRKLAEERGVELSDTSGEEPVDAPTLQLALEASAQVQAQLMGGLSQQGVDCAASNAVRGVPFGRDGGVDQGHRGKVDRVDEKPLNHLLDKGIVPLLSPLVFDREGQLVRLSSDLLAAEVSLSLQASKLIYLAPYPGLTYRGEFQVNVPVADVRERLDNDPEAIDLPIRSKAQQAVRTVEGGTPRAHLIDGRVHEGLLTEIFSKVGIGTMIHGNAYDRIRPAQVADVGPLFRFTQSAARDETLRARTVDDIEAGLAHTFLYEIDGSIIGCASLLPFEDSKQAELAAVLVQPFYRNRGVGQKLVDYAITRARKEGHDTLVALTTQTSGFFREVCGFREIDASALPASRRKLLEESGRRSHVYAFDLTSA